MKVIIALSILATLSACETTNAPPMPTGKSVPINSTATNEMLAHEAGLIVVGPKRNDPVVTESLIYRGLKLKLRPKDQQRQMFRKPERTYYARVPGAELIERTVMVPFSYGSVEFLPTPAQRFRLMQLMAVADRVEVRGRTDGRGNRVADEQIAIKRAEAARRYLLDSGVPPSIIAVNYQAAGDYIADNERNAGRGLNRRVELEFYIDDFTIEREYDFALNNDNRCLQPINIDEWQELGKAIQTKRMECIDQ